MPPKESAADKKAKKAAELQQKQSEEKVEEGRLLLEPEGKGAQPNYAKAIQCFDAAIELFPENAIAYTYKGHALREQGKHDLAIEDYTKAFSLDAQSIAAVEGRAACYDAQRQWDKSIADYTTVISIHPENDHAYNMRGSARLHKRAPGLLLKNADFGTIVNDLRTAIRLNENNYYAYCNLGKCYEDQRMYKEAVQEYTHALAVKDEYPYAVFRRGCASLALVEKLMNIDGEEVFHPGMVVEDRAVPKQYPFVNDLALSPEDVVRKELEEERKLKEVKRLLDQAVLDFTRIINPEDKALELSAIVHRGTCYLYTGEVIKANDDFQFALKTIHENANSDPPLPNAAVMKAALTVRTRMLSQLRAAKLGTA
jgi:Flp pilus assembly protein TadD